jgi:glycosyltransferase involved in cell wall biosynthesis
VRLGYLYSRYPVISQTFCDAEMLALERRGIELIIGSIHPPLTSLRHEHISCLRAPVHYAPPQEILKIWESNAKTSGKWPRDLVHQHEQKYGPDAKAELRARNALYFAEFFTQKRVDHVHVHFANRAAHTALFLKHISGISFSVTAHGQDFMKDLGSDDLLREICVAAEFVAAETDYSRDLLRQRCPDSAAKIYRVYNGIDVERFRAAYDETARPHAEQAAVAPYHVPCIISVGRLVAFKGFAHLIDACAELARRGLDFRCDIIGDGPLRETLAGKIEKLGLSPRMNLLGALSQQTVLEKLQAADIFALASTTDAEGATDVFPTVILEAMAAARPVVSTRLAGIPELVVDGETGMLVSPGDTAALADALEQLMRDPELQSRYGHAGRRRIEQRFQIEKTVAPLVKLFEDAVQAHRNRDSQFVRPAGLEPAELGAAENISAGRTGHSPMFQSAPVAYLIDRWPDNAFPLLEREIEQVRQRDVSLVPIVCELNSTARFSRSEERLAPSLEFLPDSMVLEAEWRANRALAQTLEEERAQEKNRAPSAIFSRQARFAVVLRRLLRDKKVSHVHATSSRALVCALMLKRLLNITVSATIESRPPLPQAWIEAALPQCVGGRVHDRKLLDAGRGSFVLDKTRGPRLSSRDGFWSEWAQLLLRWSSTDRKSTIESPK